MSAEQKTNYVCILCGQIHEAGPTCPTRKASDDDDVKQVTGYSCAPNSPTYWWMPQLGSSMAVGFHLFETEHL